MLTVEEMQRIKDDTLRIARSVSYHMTEDKRMSEDTADNLRGMLESIIHDLQK